MFAIWTFRFLLFFLPASRRNRNHFWISLTCDFYDCFLFLNNCRLFYKVWLLGFNLDLFFWLYRATRIFRFTVRALGTVTFLLFLSLNFCHRLSSVRYFDYSIISVYLPLTSILSIHTLLVVILILSITKEIKVYVKWIKTLENFFLFKVKFFINDLA